MVVVGRDSATAAGDKKVSVIILSNVCHELKLDSGGDKQFQQSFPMRNLTCGGDKTFSLRSVKAKIKYIEFVRCTE